MRKIDVYVFKVTEEYGVQCDVYVIKFPFKSQ